MGYLDDTFKHIRESEETEKREKLKKKEARKKFFRAIFRWIRDIIVLSSLIFLLISSWNKTDKEESILENAIASQNYLTTEKEVKAWIKDSSLGEYALIKGNVDVKDKVMFAGTECIKVERRGQGSNSSYFNTIAESSKYELLGVNLGSSVAFESVKSLKYDELANLIDYETLMNTDDVDNLVYYKVYSSEFENYALLKRDTSNNDKEGYDILKVSSSEITSAKGISNMSVICILIDIIVPVCIIVYLAFSIAKALTR